MKIKKRDSLDIGFHEAAGILLIIGLILMGVVLAIPTLTLGFQILSMCICFAGIFSTVAARYEICQGLQDG